MFKPGSRVRCLIPDEVYDHLALGLAMAGLPPMQVPKRGEVYIVKEWINIPKEVQDRFPHAMKVLGTTAITLEEITDGESRKFPAKFFELVELH